MLADCLRCCNQKEKERGKSLVSMGPFIYRRELHVTDTDRGYGTFIRWKEVKHRRICLLPSIRYLMQATLYSSNDLTYSSNISVIAY